MADTTKKRSKLGHKKEVRPGVWRVEVSSGYRADGSQRKVYGTVHGTEQDAQAEIYRIAHLMKRYVGLGSGATLDEYFWSSFAPGRRATTTRANAETCESVYRCHIAPHFGSWKLEDIDNIAVQQWIYTLPPQSADTYARVMRTVMNQAHFDHLIAESPMGDAYSFRYPRKDRAPLPVWTSFDVMDCMERLRGHRLFPIWLAMVGGGLSRSEALGMDWEDFTFSSVLGLDGAEHHMASAAIGRAYTSRDGMKDPKTSRRYRQIRIQPPFSDELYAVKGLGPICKGAKGARMSANYLPKVWKKLFERGGLLEGLPFVGINRMRATYATLMQSAGVDSTVINAMQGRSRDSRVLYSNYLAPYPSTFEHAGRALTGVLCTGGAAPAPQARALS